VRIELGQDIDETQEPGFRHRDMTELPGPHEGLRRVEPFAKLLHAKAALRDFDALENQRADGNTIQYAGNAALR
jgi:hypothetical protein